MTRAERIEAAARALMTAYWQKGEHIEVANAAQDLARALNSRKPQPDPAPAGTVLVEHDVKVYEHGHVFATSEDGLFACIAGRDVPGPNVGSSQHTVRVYYRVPLPAAPVVVEGAIVERAEREEG